MSKRGCAHLEEEEEAHAIHNDCVHVARGEGGFEAADGCVEGDSEGDQKAHGCTHKPDISRWI